MADDDWPPEIADIWSNFEGVMPDDAYEDFLNESRDLFDKGWLDSEVPEDERQVAREEFFDLMAEYDLDASLFDWDSWRDWYESA